MKKQEEPAGEYGAEQGLHHGTDEMVEALEMLSRLHSGDLRALVPEIHHRTLRGRLPAVVVEKASQNRLPSSASWYNMTKIGDQ